MTVETKPEKLDKYIRFFNSLGYEPDIFIKDSLVVIHVAANLDIPEELLGEDVVNWKLEAE